MTARDWWVLLAVLVGLLLALIGHRFRASRGEVATERSGEGMRAADDALVRL